MEKDRNGLDCNVLRFVAKLDTTRPIDLDRRFIIFFHLSDDTISMYEPPMRNSGMQLHKFSRALRSLPHNSKYTPSDFNTAAQKPRGVGVVSIIVSCFVIAIGY